MACDYCDDEVQGVADREALVDFTKALLAGDVPLARIMAGRAFNDGDMRAIESLLRRLPDRKSA